MARTRNHGKRDSADTKPSGPPVGPDKDPEDEIAVADTARLVPDQDKIDEMMDEE